MNKHHDLVSRYFHACSHLSAAEIAAYFCSDAVVYDTNHRPVTGAETIGAFYVKVRDRWDGASWHVDTFIDGASVAASEWTMLVRTDGSKKAVRGSEHYRFRDGLIEQIRQYWTYSPDDIATALKDYPYEEDARFTSEK